MSENGSSCGKGLAEHAAIPAKLAELIAALAENLELHMPALVLADPAARAEHDAYRELADEYRAIGARLAAAAHRMTRYRDLPSAEHDPKLMADPRLRDAFARYVALERDLFTLLETAVERDDRLLHG